MTGQTIATFFTVHPPVRPPLPFLLASTEKFQVLAFRVKLLDDPVVFLGLLTVARLLDGLHRRDALGDLRVAGRKAMTLASDDQ